MNGTLTTPAPSATPVTRTYGKIGMYLGCYEIEAEPHVMMMLRRLFVSAKSARTKMIQLSCTPPNSEMLAWFLQRYPMVQEDGAVDHLQQEAAGHRAMRDECEKILNGSMTPSLLKTKIPLRSYQVQAADLLRLSGSLLCGDDLGLGKTAVGLGAIAAGANPAIIVCQTHLQKQWMAEAMKFLFRCFPHIVKQTKPYRLPTHNLLIIPYSKLSGWSDALKGYKLIIFDEVQELRREESTKYAAACRLAEKCGMKLGLSATPVYNYGDEMFNICNVLNPGCLGERDEFIKEWCGYGPGGKWVVTDPQALGSYLAESRIFLRRRRADVGRELPPVTRVTQIVDYNPTVLAKVQSHGMQLAKAVLGGSFEQRGMAARELDAMMRQATGIAKAPFVAAFVADLVASGEAVLLGGWHREVYDVWKSIFDEGGIRHGFYTGSESTSQKDETRRAFLAGEIDVVIMSLRSGAGVNGLQTRSSIAVIGELDWSPKVHDQFIGRLNRDDQIGPVTAVFLVSEGGSDPLIAEVLGLKNEQSEGIINPDAVKADSTAEEPEKVAESRITQLAKALLGKHAGEAEVPREQ